MKRYLTILISTLFVFLLSCKKEVEKDKEIYDVNGSIIAFDYAKIKGKIELDNVGLTPDMVEVNSGGESARIDTEGNYYLANESSVFSGQPILVTHKSTGELLYYILSANSKSSSKRENNNDVAICNLGSEETALSLIIKNMPFNSEFSKQEIRELKNTIKTAAPDKLLELSQLIADDIKASQKLTVDEYKQRMAESISNFFVKDYYDFLKKYEEPESLDEDLLIEGMLFPDFATANQFSQAKSTEGEYNESTKSWDVNCTFYNSLPLYLAVTEANVIKNDKGELIIDADYDDMENIIEPYNTSSFYKSFTTISGVKSFYNEMIRQRFLANNWSYVENPSHSMKKTKDIELNFSRKHNSVVLLAPNSSKKVLIINVIAQVASFADLLFNKDQKTDKAKKVKKKLRDKILKKLLTDQDIATKFGVFITSLSYDSFKSLSVCIIDRVGGELENNIPVLEELFEIKDNISKPVDHILKTVVPQFKFAIDITKKGSDFFMMFSHITKKRSSYLYIQKPKIRNLYPRINRVDVPVDSVFAIEFFSAMEENEFYTGNKTITVYDENFNLLSEISDDYKWESDTKLTFTLNKLNYKTKYNILINDKFLKGKYDYLSFNGISKDKPWSFETMKLSLLKPKLLIPLNNSSNIGSDQVLRWTSCEVDDIVRYSVYLSTHSDLDEFDIINSDIIETQFNVSDLQPNSIYYWKVVAKDNLGNQTESETWRFNTINAQNTPPTKPVLITPADNATNVETDVNLKWNACSDLDGDQVLYDLYFDTSGEFTSVFSNDNVVTYSQFTDLQPNTTYYWKIVAKDNKGGVTEGDKWSFTTKSETTINLPVVSTSAISNITETAAKCGGNITNNGGADVTARGVCWSKNQAPTIADNKTLNGTGNGAFSSVVSGLNGNTKYYIRAYATNSKGTSYGTEKSFVTKTAIAKPVVSSVSPDKANLGEETTFTVTGTNLTDDLLFHLEDLVDPVGLGVNADKTEFKFKGMPSYTAGPKNGVIKTADKEVLHTFGVLFEQVIPDPEFYNVTPKSVKIGEEATFTVTGKNLRNDIVFNMIGLSNTSFVSLSTDKTTIKYKGVPSGTPGLKHLRVQSKDGANPKTFNITFIKENTPPVRPVLKKPLNGEANLSTVTTLVWNPCYDADNDKVTYDVYLTKEISNFGNPIHTGISSTSVSTTSMIAGEEYYWKVVATDAEGNTSESDIWSFRVGGSSANQNSGIPWAGITNPDDGLVLSRKYHSGYINEDDKYLVDGWSETGKVSWIKLHINGSKKSVSDPNSGSWSVLAELSGGANEIYITSSCNYQGCSSQESYHRTVYYVKKPDIGYCEALTGKVQLKYQGYWYKADATYYPYFRVWRSETNDPNDATARIVTDWIRGEKKYGDTYGDNGSVFDTNVVSGKSYYYFVEMSPYSDGRYSSELSGPSYEVVAK